MDNGVVTEIRGERVLRFERRLRHPVERVWSALTEPAELIKWLADGEVDLREGGRVHLRWLNTDDQGNHAISDGTISQLEPPRLIEYGSSNHGRLRWELEEADGGTRLTFTCPVPPEEFRSLAAAGWHIHLEHLADALEGRAVDWPNWDTDHRPRWEEIREGYAAARA